MTGNGRLTYVLGLATGLGIALAAPWLVSGSLPAGGVAAQAAPPAEVAPLPAPLVAAVAQQVDPAAPLTLAEARPIIAGAIGRAQSRGQRMAVAVMDNGGTLISEDRMDDASPSSVKGAVGKAFAAAMRRQTTAAIAAQIETRPDIYFSLMNMYHGEVYLVAGGQPLRVNGRMLGAVGVSGLPQGEDDEAVEAGIAAWRPMRPGAGQ